MSNLITSMCDDCKYVKYSFDGGSTKCGYRGKKDCNFTPRENKDLFKKEVEPEIRNEAIKEFAERLKSKLNDLELRTKTQRKTVTVKFCDDNANWVMHECIPEEIDEQDKEIIKLQNVNKIVFLIKEEAEAAIKKD